MSDTPADTDNLGHPGQMGAAPTQADRPGEDVDPTPTTPDQTEEPLSDVQSGDDTTGATGSADPAAGGTDAPDAPGTDGDQQEGEAGGTVEGGQGQVDGQTDDPAADGDDAQVGDDTVPPGAETQTDHDDLKGTNDPDGEVGDTAADAQAANDAMQSAQGVPTEADLAGGDDEVDHVEDDPADPLEEPIRGDDESDDDYQARVRSWRSRKAARTRAENKAAADTGQ